MIKRLIRKAVSKKIAYHGTPYYYAKQILEAGSIKPTNWEQVINEAFQEAVENGDFEEKGKKAKKEFMQVLMEDLNSKCTLSDNAVYLTENLNEARNYACSGNYKINEDKAGVVFVVELDVDERKLFIDDSEIFDGIEKYEDILKQKKLIPKNKDIYDWLYDNNGNIKKDKIKILQDNIPYEEFSKNFSDEDNFGAFDVEGDIVQENIVKILVFYNDNEYLETTDISVAGLENIKEQARQMQN